MSSQPDSPAPPHRLLLTFDDGPDPVHTLSVLDELACDGLRAVFFVLGRKLESPGSRAILERIAGEGHVIGNHGYSHQKLTQLTDDQIRTEFRRTETLIGDLDRGVKLWRPPYGDRDDRVDSVMTSLGYTRMLWNVDSLDYRDDPEAATWVDRALEWIRLRQTRGFRNSVCLLHDPLPVTAAQLGRMLELLRELEDTRIARYDPSHPDGLRLPGDPEPAPGLPVCPSDAVSFRIGDSRVVARTGIGTLYVLNESAGLLWDTLARGASEADAAQDLARRYDIAEDLAARDVQAALANWRTRGLLGPKSPELEDAGPWPRSLNEVSIAPAGGFEEEHAYRFLDLRFRIRFQTPGLAAAIHPRFANLETRETSPPDSVFEVVIPETPAGADSRGPGRRSFHWRSAAGSSAASGFVSDACALRLPDAVVTLHQSAAALAYRLFFEIVRLAHPGLDPMACLHSSLLGCGTGAIALVGNNGSGKSTLTAGLASSGLSVFADDRLFVDFGTQRPAATPNAISLKRGSWAPLQSRYPGLLRLPLIRSEGEEVRFLPAPPPTERLLAPVKHMFFPRFSAAAATAAIPLTAIQAIERIGAAEGWISSDPAKLGAFLRWTERLQCYDLPFSNLDTAMERIGECLRP